MFEFLKQMGDLRRADKVKREIGIARQAIAAGDIHTADYALEAAYKLCLETMFVRTFHTELQFLWGVIGLKVRDMGYPELADHCTKMNALLQARFEAGEYYADRLVGSRNF